MTDDDGIDRWVFGFGGSDPFQSPVFVIGTGIVTKMGEQRKFLQFKSLLLSGTVSNILELQPSLFICQTRRLGKREKIRVALKLEGFSLCRR